jgi:hypothetical protein
MHRLVANLTSQFVFIVLVIHQFIIDNQQLIQYSHIWQYCLAVLVELITDGTDRWSHKDR